MNKNMNIEDRLYNCFKTAFDEENGKLCIPIDQSTLVYDSAGYNCSDEFFDEMYQRWLNEGNIDKARNKD